jgi:hypothetical protein
VAAQAAEGKGEDGCEACLEAGKVSGKVLIGDSGEVVRRRRHTLSKHKTMMSMATLVLPCVRVAASPNTKHMPRYTASMYRGLNGFSDISMAARKRLKA